jgi:hypothetical protein
MSTINMRRPLVARKALKLMTLVVLPTPPF